MWKENITADRKEWSSQIRKIAMEILLAKDIGSIRNGLTELKLRINAYGQNRPKAYLSDGHIWNQIFEIEKYIHGKSELSFTDEEEYQMKIANLINYISLLLKDGWEQSKAESKFNTPRLFILITNAIGTLSISVVSVVLWDIRGELDVNDFIASFFFVGMLLAVGVLLWAVYFYSSTCGSLYSNNYEFETGKFKVIRPFFGFLFPALLVYAAMIIIACFSLFALMYNVDTFIKYVPCYKMLAHLIWWILIDVLVITSAAYFQSQFSIYLRVRKYVKAIESNH